MPGRDTQDSPLPRDARDAQQGQDEHGGQDGQDGQDGQGRHSAPAGSPTRPERPERPEPPPRSARHDRLAPSRTGRSVLVVLPGLLLAMLLGALDQTIMAPALPAVAGELGGLDQMPSVVTAYLVAATAAMPIYGKLGDRFGRKPVILAAIAVFVLGALLCGAAPSMPALVAARAVQGIGGGGLMIGAQAIIGEIVSPRERGRYLGYVGAAYVVAAVGGPLIGGFLVDRLSWRWIFALYPPLGIAAFALLATTLRLPRPGRGDGRRPGLDHLGALTLAATVTSVVLLGQTGDPIWIPPTLGGGVLWFLSARTAADPVLPLRLFRDRAFALPVAIAFLLGFALFGTLTYLPAYVQIAFGATATEAGLLVTALMAGVLVTTVASGRLITATGRYRPYPVAGTAVAALGMGLLALVGGRAGVLALGGVMLVIGLGVGLVLQVMVLAAQNAVAHADLGAATSAVTFLRQIGASVGVAVVGALLTMRFPGGLPTTATDLAESTRDTFATVVPPTFGVMVPVLLVALVLAVVMPVRTLRTTSHVDRRPTTSGEKRLS